jgi:hypothetical protein
MESIQPCPINVNFKAEIDFVLGSSLPPLPENLFHDGIDSPQGIDYVELMLESLKV